MMYDAHVEKKLQKMVQRQFFFFEKRNRYTEENLSFNKKQRKKEIKIKFEPI